MPPKVRDSVCTLQDREIDVSHSGSNHILRMVEEIQCFFEQGEFRKIFINKIILRYFGQPHGQTLQKVDKEVDVVMFYEVVVKNHEIIDLVLRIDFLWVNLVIIPIW